MTQTTQRGDDEMKVTELGNGLFDVESESDPSISYVVNTVSVCCSCPDWRARRSEKALDDPQRLCKHARKVMSQPQPTKLERAATVAKGLSDADLQRYAAERNGSSAGCACLLELAARAAAVARDAELRKLFA